MGIIKKQAFQSSVFIYTGVALAFITTGILAPNYLTPGQIGTINLIASWSGIFAGIGILGFTTVTVRFFPYFRNEKTGHNGFLLLSILTGAIGFLFFLAIYYPIKPWILEMNQEKSPLFARFFYLVIPLTFFQIYFSLLDVYNNMLYRSSTGIILREFIQRILVLTGMLFFIFHLFGFNGFIYYYTAAICFPTVLLVIYLAEKKALNFQLNTKMLTGKLMRSMASVSFFGFLNTFSNLAIIRIDAIMVNHFIDSAATGIYVTSYYFGTLVQMPARALNRIAPVMIADAYKENDMETIRDIYHKSSLNLYIIALWLLLGLTVNLDNIYKIIPETYSQGRMIIVYIALANVVRLAGGSNDSIIAFSKYYKFTTLFLVIFLVLIFSFNLYFIPQKGITGAAIASLAAISIFQAIKIAFIYIKFGFHPFNWKFIHIAAAAALVYLTADLLYPFQSFIADIILRSVMVTVLYGGYIYFTDISPDINQSIMQFVARVKSIFQR